MIKLAQLAVDLTLNAAQFVTGFEASKRELKNFSKEVGSSLSEVGNVASQALGELGAMGGEVGATLSSVGQAATSAFAGFARLGGPVGVLAGVGAAAAVGMSAMSIAAIGIAIHAAEAAAKLEDLSHMTGVSVETLSKLSIVGKTIAPDVDIETIAKSLDRMDRAMLKAATSSATTITPFQRMGIAVKDADGNLRSGEVVFSEIATKFAGMADGALKTGLAMEIFGRGGAALIPILDEGGEKIQHIIDVARKFGAIITSETAEAAHKFQENLAELGIAALGLENRLMVALLPALTAITGALDRIAEGTIPMTSAIAQATEGLGQFEDRPALQAYIDDVAKMTKGFISLAVSVAELFGELAATTQGVITNLGIVASFMNGQIGFGQMTKQIQENNDAVVASEKRWQSLRDTIKSAVNAPNVAPTGFNLLDHFERQFDDEKKRKGSQGINLQSDAAKQAELTIREQIAKLEGQAEAEGLLANAISSVSSATIQATAHAEALKTITTLNAQAAKQHVSVTAAQAQQIEIATQRLDAYKAALNINKELESQTQKVRASTAALIELAAAYSKGGAAVLGAQEQSKLAPLSDKVGNLQEVFDTLRQKPVTGKLAEELRVLGTALDQAKAKLQEAASSLHEEDLAKYTAEIAKEQSAVAGALPFLERLNSAYLQSEEAVRQAKVALELYNFEVAHPGASTDQVEGQRQIFEQQSRQAHDAQIAQEAGQFSLQRILSDTNARYAAIKETIQSMGQSTLLVDAAIYDSNVRIIKQWDDAAFKVGTLKEKFTGFFNELVLQGQNLGAKVFGSMLQAVDSLENELAKLLTGEKTNFGAIGKQLEQSIIKAQMQAVIGQAAGALDKLFPGLHAGDILKGKPDGTDGNPLHVIVKNPLSSDGGSKEISAELLSSLRLKQSPNDLSGLPGSLNEGYPSASSGGELASGLAIGGNLASTFGSMIPGPAGAVASIAGGIAGSIGSAMKSSKAGPANGTQSSPFHVLVDNQSSGSGGIPGPPDVSNLPLNMGPMSGISGLLTPAQGPSGDSGGGDGGGIGGAVGGAFSAVGGFFKNLFSHFGGGMADGGDMEPGKWYVTGERHPEIIAPKRPMSVYASMPRMTGTYGAEGGGSPQFHFHGVENADTFKRNKGQMAAWQQQTTYAAHLRHS